ncbi:hypothetical protein [Streptomyces malaysiensis]|uniref:Uncharacterized protein n=1 Tax=Streptomyces malaysiensis subsp. samsunensis TaxID=459658 RepID=A0A9X2RY90_STRMQ|nr:hypothetical protein [Streptomyces samsunensis]MCQ8835092.1 hypothetical protein [Streptomyces samsunensis]
MTDTPVPNESTSPAGLASSAENTEVTGVAEITERVRLAERAGDVGAAEAVHPPVEADDLVIEDLSEAAWAVPAAGICICTVGAE